MKKLITLMLVMSFSFGYSQIVATETAPYFENFDANFNPGTGTNNAGSTIDSSWYRNNLPWRAYNEYACHLDTHKQHRAAICLTHAFYAHSTKYSCAHKRLFANRNR